MYVVCLSWSDGDPGRGDFDDGGMNGVVWQESDDEYLWRESDEASYIQVYKEMPARRDGSVDICRCRSAVYHDGTEGEVLIFLAWWAREWVIGRKSVWHLSRVEHDVSRTPMK